ncbi:MAG: tol-pal system-associated acyl-CoA thioesterase [Succinivibrionaceae bacterium]
MAWGKIMESATFKFPIRIYYEDTDAGGVVYNANYVKFLERARTEWLRAKNCEQHELLDDGIGFVVVSINMNFKRAARLDDELFVCCEIASARNVSVDFKQKIIDKDGNVYVDAMVKVACVDLKKMAPRPFPEKFKEVFIK